MPLDSFLKDVKGIIHVGANTGQERDTYARHGLNVVWVEPNPVVFDILQVNIAGMSQQVAYRRLLAADDGVTSALHIANNNGLSSSILDLAQHCDIWPETVFVEDIVMTTTTLDRLVEDEHIDLGDYDALVLDTQGSELMVLKGASRILNRFRFVKAEVADFEAYVGCCQLAELSEFMHQRDFRLFRKDAHIFERNTMNPAQRKTVGTYFDVLYRRENS